MERYCDQQYGEDQKNMTNKKKLDDIGLVSLFKGISVSGLVRKTKKKKKKKKKRKWWYYLTYSWI